MAPRLPLPPDFKDRAKTRDRFPWNPGSLLGSLLEMGGEGGQWGEEWSAGRGVSTGQFLHLRQGPLFFERYSSRRRLRRRCCHRRRCLRPLKRFLKKRGGRRRRGGPRDANFLSFYFILFYFIFSLSLSFLLPLSFSLSLLTVNGGDSR